MEVLETLLGLLHHPQTDLRTLADFSGVISVD